VYFRFFSPIKRMSDALAHRQAVVDYNDRFAIVATTHRPNAKERIVRVARYDRARGTDVAEVAVAVIDEFQRRGLGSALLAELARVGRAHGIKTFSLIVVPENREMLDLLRKMGWIHQAKLVGGCYLAYLGIRTLVESRQRPADLLAGAPPAAPAHAVFRQRFLSAISNPKLGVFFVTFLPQFVLPGQAVLSRLLVLGVIFAV